MFLKCSLLDIQNKLAKMYWTQPLRRTPSWTLLDFMFNLLFPAAYFDSKDSAVATQKLNNLSFTLQSEEIETPSDFKEIPALHHGNRVYREVIIESYFQGKWEFL